MKKTMLLIFVFLVLISSCSNSNLISTSIYPSNHIKYNNVITYKDKVIINQENVAKCLTSNTDSMYPTIGNATLLLIEPNDISDISVGDIILFKNGGVVILTNGIEKIYNETAHRVVEKNKDSEGIYFITRGDNNLFKDGQKVRFENITYIVIGIIY